jgi:hypothetical protein
VAIGVYPQPLLETIRPEVTSVARIYERLRERAERPQIQFVSDNLNRETASSDAHRPDFGGSSKE